MTRPIDGEKLVEWLKFHIADFNRLADSHQKMEDIRRLNECREQAATYEHYLRVVESGKFDPPSEPVEKCPNCKGPADKADEDCPSCQELICGDVEVCEKCGLVGDQISHEAEYGHQFLPKQPRELCANPGCSLTKAGHEAMKGLNPLNHRFTPKQSSGEGVG